MEPPDESLSNGDLHTQAASAFVRMVTTREIRGLESLILFGSTVRNETAGIESDVDFLAIIADEADRATVEDELRDIAYDVMLEYGPVVEIHAISRSSFEARREGGHPFVRRVIAEGRSYV